jgi:adenine-specific DNA methylase
MAFSIRIIRTRTLSIREFGRKRNKQPFGHVRPDSASPNVFVRHQASPGELKIFTSFKGTAAARNAQKVKAVHLVWMFEASSLFVRAINCLMMPNEHK